MLFYVLMHVARVGMEPLSTGISRREVCQGTHHYSLIRLGH